MNNTIQCEIQDRIEGEWLIIITVFGSITAIVSTLGNVVVISAFINTKKLHKPCNVMLTNIAVSDVMLCVVGFAVFIAPEYFRQIYCNDTFTQARFGILYFVLNLSKSSLVITSIERLIGIQWPFRYHSFMTFRISILLSAAAWVFTVIRAVHASLRFPQEVNASRIIEVIVNVLEICVTVACNSRVYVISRWHLNQDRLYGIRTQDSKSQAVVKISLVYLVSWSLPLVLWTVDLITGNVKHLRQISMLPPLLGTLANVYIYSFRMKDYREAIKQLLPKSCRRSSWTNTPGGIYNIF
ncbi:rhodopsin, G0-coupled-like [Haliotis rufescens]|uniref:rhodopsin, G0-coupled-like n=1 Tax=Haliotis rufescens TaxID=6454 RepID=UPI00201F23A4|nr:rhodopsin, G0-coupled-like [Haliotis rufescens]